ncbi:MAG: ABZJ_00895 family protein [Marinovum sp.]|nr:ABZJ_00895 family protein [Marinovum sp.]
MPDSIRLYAIFTAAFIGIAILFAVIEMVLGFSVSASGFISAFMAAMVSGQVFGRRKTRVPTSAESWRHALGFTLVVISVSVVQILAIGFNDPMYRHALTSPVFAGVAIVYLLGILLACRFFFPLSAKGIVKSLEKSKL